MATGIDETIGEKRDAKPGARTGAKNTPKNIADAASRFGPTLWR
jgi:hypothetical protein